MKIIMKRSEEKDLVRWSKESTGDIKKHLQNRRIERILSGRGE